MSYQDEVPLKKMKIENNQFTNAIAPNENSSQGFHSYKCEQASKKDFSFPSGSLELSVIGPFQPVEVIDSDEQPLLTCMLG